MSSRCDLSGPLDRTLHIRELVNISTMTDYSTVTEATGEAITQEAASMLFTRYEYAARHCVGRDVLEIACGSGQGLGLLTRRARRVVGGDFTEALLRQGYDHYRSQVPRIPLIRLDAHHLPFAERSFDVIILFEAIYYLSCVDAFLMECYRVLRPSGTLLISTVNPEWSGFNRSPFSVNYFSERELRTTVSKYFQCVECYGGFRADSPDGVRWLISVMRVFAARWHLIPRTMAGKRLLKRLFFGKLVRVPHEITEGKYCQPVHLSSEDRRPPFKVIYSIANRS